MKKGDLKGLFEGRSEAPAAFIPYVFSYAARVAHLPVKDLLQDPTQLSVSLQRTQRLFGYDALVCNFDTTLEAEALGCSLEWSGSGPQVVSSSPLDPEMMKTVDLESRGRIPVVLEATKRLAMTVGREMPQLAGVTGPCTLGCQLTGKGVGSIERGLLEVCVTLAIRMVRAFYERGVDGILLTDDMLGLSPPEILDELGELLAPLLNVSKYYDRPCLLVTKCGDVDRARRILGLGAPGVSLGRQFGDLFDEARSLGVVMAHCLSFEDLRSMASLTERSRFLASGEGTFLTTEWGVPLDIAPEAIHAVVRAIRAPVT